MRKTMNIGIGIGVAALATAIATGAAFAATGAGAHPAASQAPATATAARHVTLAQAEKIALAMVPHSQVREAESDFRHDRAVWQIQLATPSGRVVVDVGKKTGAAVIVLRGGGDDRGDRRGPGRPGDARDHDGHEDDGPASSSAGLR